MDILKAAILIACIMGVISCMVDIATPEGALKKQLKVIVSIILILAVFLPFMGNDFNLDFDDYGLRDDGTYEQMSEDFFVFFSGLAVEEMEEVIASLIDDSGISIENVIINAEYDEYNSLEATKVIISAVAFEDKDKEVIRDIISERLPEAEIEFKVTDND